MLWGFQWRIGTSAAVPSVYLSVIHSIYIFLHYVVNGFFESMQTFFLVLFLLFNKFIVEFFISQRRKWKDKKYACELYFAKEVWKSDTVAYINCVICEGDCILCWILFNICFTGEKLCLLSLKYFVIVHTNVFDYKLVPASHCCLWLKIFSIVSCLKQKTLDVFYW